MRKLPLLLLALAGAATAQTPADFAWQWPIVAAGEQSAYQLVLDEPVYARIVRGDLRDLAVVNADGQPVPFAPLAEVVASREQHSELRWLRVANTETGTGDAFSLSLERDADGRVRDLQIDTESAAATTPSSDLLIDLGEDPASVSAIRLTPGEAARSPINLRVDVLASDDLAYWQTLGRGLAYVSIFENGLHVERLRLDFGASRQRYLRLRLAPGQSWPALAKVEQVRNEAGAVSPWQTLALEGQPVAGEPGTFEYRSIGPLPISRLDLRLAAPNAVAAVQFESRDSAEAPWRLVDSLTAFRLGTDDEEVRQLPADVGLHRERHWRIRSLPALAQAPTLLLGYRPDRFVLLAQGPAPYRLLAGSVRTQRPDYPVQVALAAAGASKPAGWQPPVATLGAGSAAEGGDAVLAPDRGPQHRRWLLWAVLGIGVVLVLVVALRVLRAPAAAD